MKRKLLWGSFALYTFLMLWLLFFRHRGLEVTDYWAQVAGRLRLVPLVSVREVLATGDLQYIIYILGGNIAMFVPLGFLLPALLPKCRGFGRCMGTVAILMTVVELCQLFTLRGFCETDDVLFNVCGAAIGWLVAKNWSGA